jgi:hypothetical protein
MAEQSPSTQSANLSVTDPSNPLDVPADYVRTLNTEHHLTEHVHGNRTAFDQTSETDDASNGTFDNRVMTIVDGALTTRKQAEDKRANERNRNRILILVVVLIMELLVPTLYGMHLLPALFLKYEVLAITAPDALLTVYAYVKKY